MNVGLLRTRVDASLVVMKSFVELVSSLVTMAASVLLMRVLGAIKMLIVFIHTRVNA